MIIQGNGEKRVDYLLRVLKIYLAANDVATVEYDESTYDTDCLLCDLKDAIEDGERE